MQKWVGSKRACIKLSENSQRSAKELSRRLPPGLIVEWIVFQKAVTLIFDLNKGAERYFYLRLMSRKLSRQEALLQISGVYSEETEELPRWQP